MFDFGQRHLNGTFVLDGIQSVSARDAILREVISNSLAHRDYSSGYAARMVIERERILAANGNRAHGIGALDIKTFEPYSKNPPISKNLQGDRPYGRAWQRHAQHPQVHEALQRRGA